MGGGQNISLISKITEFKIKVISETEDKELYEKEYLKSIENLKPLEISNIKMQRFIKEGFQNIDNIVKCETSELENIQGFTKEEISQIKSRAEQIYLSQKQKVFEYCLKKGANLEMLNLLTEYLILDDILSIVDKNILTIRDIAKMDNLEFQEITKENVLLEDINNI